MRKIILFVGACICFFKSYGQVKYTFSSSTTTFKPLTTSTNAPLTGAFTPDKTLLDESFSNNLPIGFDFMYNGKIYTKIHASSNGFASLGSPFVRGKTVDPQYEINELSAGSGYKGAIRPVLAPFWDNLILSDNTGISYATTGTSPNRIFTLQWMEMKWISGSPAISFQLKLFEKNNAIEFVYLSESGAGGNDKSASIGISTTRSDKILFGLDSMQFLSINISMGTATADRFTETKLGTKPNTGQVFRFTPENCMPPADIDLVQYNETRATLSWNKIKSVSDYQYALSTEDIIPFATTTTTSSRSTFDGLTPGTDYYFYLKSGCGNSWSRFKFTTPVKQTLPYAESFENVTDNLLPKGITDTHEQYAFADAFWQVTDAITAADGERLAMNAAPFSAANSWMFTPSFPLIQGNTYTLKFKVSATGGKHAYQIKYGRRAGADSMIYSLLNDTNFSSTSYRTKQVSISPPGTGNYFLGFHYYTDVNDDMFFIDDISVKLNTTAAIPLTARLNERNETRLQWRYEAVEDLQEFILERSKDGIHFSRLGSLLQPKYSGTDHEYTDLNPNEGWNYYRVTAVNTNNSTSSSELAVVELTQSAGYLLYPNPSRKQIFLKIPDSKKVTVKVYSTSGQQISINQEPISPSEIKLIATQPLSAGLYLVHVSTETQTLILKWVVL
jgi:hypothetical protein